MKKRILLAGIVLAMLMNTSVFATPALTGGVLDRPFNENRTMYYVEIADDTIPDITMEGYSVIQQATTPYVSGALKEENTTILENAEGKIYRFVFEKKGGTINIAKDGVNISSDGKLTVKGNVGSLRNIKILIMKPIEKFSEEYFKYDEIKDKLNMQSKILNVLDVTAEEINRDGLSYQFPNDAQSGQYGILITADGINSSYFSGYYMSSADMKDAIDNVNKKVKFDDTNTPEKLKEYIEENQKPLYLDTAYYNKLSDSAKIIAVKEMELENGEAYAGVEDIAKAFYKGVAIAWINEGKSAVEILAQYNQYLILEMYDNYSNLEDKTIVDEKIEKAETEENLREIFNHMVSVAMVNEAEPSELAKIIEDNKGYLNLSSDMYKYFKNNTDKCVRAFRNKTFKDADDIEAAIKAVKDKETGNGGGSSSSGGGISSGGGNSGSWIAPVTTQKDAIAITPTTSETNNQENAEKPILPFTDIDSVGWAHIAIGHLYNNKILNGKSETLFAPNDYITREEFVKLVVNAFNLEGSSDIKFKDVPEGAWYADYVKIAFNNKIVNGMSEDEFGVGEYITREDIAVMIYRAVQKTGLDVNIIIDNIPKLNDLGSVRAYAIDAVNFMVEKGAVNGIDGNFRPADKATRAQASKMLYEIIKVR